MTTYWQRREAARAHLLAAREALDACERRLERYREAVSQDTGYRTYLRLEKDRYLATLREQALAEATEVSQHLRDALEVWWPSTAEDADHG